MAFERGGNALDAAIAAAVTLAVCYPHMNGVGGDLFALVHQPAGDTVAVNGSGRAPSGADREAAAAAGGGHMPERGPHTVTVPGAVSGWEALHRLGAALPWRDAFTQAVALAYGGVAVSRSLSQILAGPDRPGAPGEDPLGAIFAPEGTALPGGRAVPAARARRHPHADRRRGPRRPLRRRGGRPLRRGTPCRGGSHHARGPRRAPRGPRSPAACALPKRRRPGAPAQLPGVPPAGGARHGGAARHRPRPAGPGHGHARHDLPRGGARPRPPPRRPRRDAVPSLDPARRRPSRGARRRGALGRARRPTGPTPPRRRHDRARDRGRRRPRRVL